MFHWQLLLQSPNSLQLKQYTELRITLPRLLNKKVFFLIKYFSLIFSYHLRRGRLKLLVIHQIKTTISPTTTSNITILHNNGNNILKIAVVTSSKLTATPIIIKMVIDTNTISTQGQSLSVEKLKLFLCLCIWECLLL